MQKICFVVYVANRGFFPEKLLSGAREDLAKAISEAGYESIFLDEKATRFGGVETAEEGRRYAKFLKENEGKYDGVIMTLPNFGDENGALEALKDCGVPILIQAYPDEAGKMDPANRRDSFCGKMSMCDVFYQRKLPFTLFKPHTVHPDTSEFRAQLDKFAAVCRVVKGMRRFNVGAIGARTTPFKTIRFDELALQKQDINTETLDLLDIAIRMRAVDKKSAAFKECAEKFRNYSDFGCVDEEKFQNIVSLSLVLDDVIAEYSLDCLALRCWIEIEKEFGFSPCVVLSELNNRGIGAACELDVCNAVVLRALYLASGEPAACLDWNNNFGDDDDKCILFHCGPVPQAMMETKGHIVDHPMLAKSVAPGCGWGCNAGRIKKTPMSYSSMKTEDGKMIFYLGEGEFTGESIEDAFFGCGGVAKIDGLQDKLYAICKQGFRHHMCATSGYVRDVLKEAFETYLGYEVVDLDRR